MRITARKAGFRGQAAVPVLSLLLCVGGLLPAQDEKPAWLPVIAGLASALSQNDAVGALEWFDSGAKNYAVIERDISALVAQADVLCSIEVIDNREDEGGARILGVDWYMQLTPHSNIGPTERRRARILLTTKHIRGKWKIVAIFPLSIFSPILIK